VTSLREKISFSEWSAWNGSCKWRWKLDYLDARRYDNPSFSFHFDFGTAVHSAIDALYDKKNPVDVTRAQDIFEEKFRAFVVENREKWPEDQRVGNKAFDIEESVVAGRKIVADFCADTLLSGLSVVATELLIESDIDREDHPLRFKGYVDYIAKGKDGRGRDVLYLLDHKTCSWGWNKAKRTDEAVLAQLRLYKHFVCKERGLSSDQVRTGFNLLKRTPQKGSSSVETFIVSSGPVAMQNTLDRLNSDISDIRERVSREDFPATKSSCVDKWGKTCPYFDREDLCPRSSRK